MPRFKYCTDQKKGKKGSESFWCMLWLQGLFSRKAFFSLMVYWDPGGLLKTGHCSMNRTERTLLFFPKNWCLLIQFLAIKFTEISRISDRWHLNAKQEEIALIGFAFWSCFPKQNWESPAAAHWATPAQHQWGQALPIGSDPWFWELPLFKSSSPRMTFQKGWCLSLTKQSLVQHCFLLTAFCW